MDQVITRVKVSFADLPVLLKRSYGILVQNDPLRMAGATAFFTSFALPFILIILTQLLGLIINPLRLRQELFKDLSDIFGKQSVRQIINTLIAFRELADNLWITIFGTLFLLLVATTLLMIIKGSINQLWKVRPVRGRSIFKKIRTRLKSVFIIIATGILIVISIIAEAFRAFMGKNIGGVPSTVSYYFNGAITQILSLIFVILWLSILFRFLPDARPTWRVAITGAFVTGLLFTAGKFILRLLLTYSNLGSLYGTSAGAVLILLFVFYSSLILYFGAAFTRVWAEHLHQHIKPLDYASRYRLTEVKE